MSAPAPPPAFPAFDAAPLVGALLDGRYALTGHIATGGMGAVFRAQHVHLRKPVAVKLLRPELSALPDLVERFRREAEIASHLEHDHIVKVTDFGKSAEGHLFLVMELLEGESLFDRIRREGPLPPEEAVPVLVELCAGLEAAHALGVVHRDLKPENVFLARQAGGREVTKILDFGIAKLSVAGSPSATQAGMVVGTPEYLSPEQAMGIAVDARADLYTVGLLAFRALTGRHPWQGDDARALLVKQASTPVPPLSDALPHLAAWPRLVGAVEAACRKDPGERPQTASALGLLFARALEPAAVQVVPTPWPVRSPLAAEVEVPSSAAAMQAGSPVPGEALSVLLTPASDAAPSVHPERRGRVESPAPRVGPVVEGRAGVARALQLARALTPRAWLALLAMALLLPLGFLGAVRLERARAAAHARALLDADQAGAALAALDALLAKRPADADLRLLRARALAHLPGRAADALDGYAAAAALAPLEPEALVEVAAYLGRERRLADRAARILRQAGPAAVASVSARAREGDGLLRLRSLALLRDLGAEDAVDRTALYTGLLGDPGCELRRAAAQRLGELADPAALPALKAAAEARAPASGGHAGPACGAAEAGEAARRIEAARSQASR